MAVKVTFTLDDETIREIALTAERLHKPKSQVVREAVHQYHQQSDRLSEADRRRLLTILDEFATQPPTRPQSDVEKELAELRAVRRRPGRLHPVD